MQDRFAPDVAAPAVRRRRTRGGIATVSAIAAAIAFALSATFLAPVARADDTNDYCRKVTAQAQSDAALLMAPSVSAQVIRYPASNVADVTGLQVGKGIQPRAALAYGLVDAYRGLGVLDVASADCKRQVVAAELQEIIVARADVGRLPALDSELAFLQENRGAVTALVQEAEQRRAVQASTLTELSELRKSALEIDRKIFETARDAAVLRRRGFRMPKRSLAEMLNDYDERALAYEQSLSHVRKVQAWKLDLSGGIATSPEVDYFAVANLTYNFGGLFQGPAEHREVTARQHELKSARYELRYQIETMLDELRLDLEHSRAELQSFDDELARIAKERTSLDALDAPNKAGVLAALTLEGISLGADRAYLGAYTDALAKFGGRQ